MAKRGAISKLNLQLPPFNPMTLSQQKYQAAVKGSTVTLALGWAGTGKTYGALHLGLMAVEAGEYDRILIVRSVVPVREMGFLPGTMQEKTEPYKAPYKATINRLLSCGSAFTSLEKHGLIDFVSTSFEQGKTYERSFVIVDECQNLSLRELDLTMTRLGDECKIVYCGDRVQRYIDKPNDLDAFTKILAHMDDVDRIHFTMEDIVRSALVKNYIIAREKLGLAP